MEKIMSPAPHIYAVNPYPPHKGIIMPPYMQQQQLLHPHYYYQPPSSEEAMHHQQLPVPTSCSSSALPYGVNYSTSCYPLYHAPTPFCCNHIPRSSYSPSVVLQPPQPQLWGAQPVHHIPPPSYVVAESPMYKNSTVNHCCGCPNHVCTPKDASPIIKVEEKDPSLSETRNMMQSPRGGGSEDQSLRLADCPYPFHLWRVPALDHEKNKNDLVQLGDGRNSQNQQQQQGEDRKQFPFPFVFVPYSSPKQEGGAENIQNKDGSLRSSQEHSVLGTKNDSFNSGKGDNDGESRLGGGNSAADMNLVLRPKEISSSSSKKVIPVKDVPESPHGHHHQHNDDDEKRMRHSASENSTTEDGSCSRVDALKQPEEKEASQVKKNKSSKLPPVCLRLEPLKKKKTSGDKEGSRSPSSPATKNTTTSMEGAHSDTSSDNNEKHHPMEKKVKKIEVKDDTGKDEKDVIDTSTTIQIVEEEKSQKNAATSASSEEEKKTEQPEIQKRRKMLSETEAATYIQSVYRGFEVRKSETLEKLKQLGKIHDEVTKMKKSVEDLKFSWSSDDAVDQVKLKQKIAIGESIMGLLLRLDTIQGLHPSLRDIRKSMAKELVALQEQLDSISSSCDEASLKNKEHGDMYCAAKNESPIPEVMNQEGLSAEEDSLPLEATTPSREVEDVEEEKSEEVSDGVEDEKKNEKADDDDGLLQKNVQEEVEQTMSIVTDEQEEEDDQDKEEEETVIDHRDGVGEQVVQVDDNGDQCKVVVLEEEKEKMQEMMERLMDAGKEQLDVILSLTSRVEDLEQKLATTRRRRKRICNGNNVKAKQKKAVLRRGKR